MAPSLIERRLLALRNAPAHYAGLVRPPVGQTERQLVWRRDTAQLWRYRGSGERLGPPVVVVHSLISESTILDLLPGASMIGSLLGDGFDVFLLDWARCHPADGENTLETYVEEYLPAALGEACRLAGARDVTLVGYCLGGVLALLYAAGDPVPPVRSLVTLTTPCTFAEMGLMSRMFVEGRLDPDDVIDATGLVPAETIDAGFRLVKPTDDLVQSANVFQRLWDNAWLDGYTAISRWARRQLPFPGAAFRQIVTMLIRDDALARGTVALGGREIALSNLSCALLNVYCDADELVPAAAARPLLELVGSTDREELVLSCGHVGLVAGSAAAAALAQISEWMRRRSDGDRSAGAPRRGRGRSR